MLKSAVPGLGAHFQNHGTTHLNQMITMQDTNSRYSVGRKSPSSGDSALTPLPRAESFSLDDLPLPVPGGYGSRATGVKCYDVRGERVKGKQVKRELWGGSSTTRSWGLW